MNKQGWLTRSADAVGGEGQTQATLTVHGMQAAVPTVRRASSRRPGR